MKMTGRSGSTGAWRFVGRWSAVEPANCMHEGVACIASNSLFALQDQGLGSEARGTKCRCDASGTCADYHNVESFSRGHALAQQVEVELGLECIVFEGGQNILLVEVRDVEVA